MKKKALLRLGLLIIIIGAVIVMAVKFIGKNDADKNNENIVVENNKVNEEMVTEKKPQGIAIPGWEKITIPANTTEVTVDFNNPEQNKDLYYLTFELRLLTNNENEYEVLYTSDFIEPGEHVGKVTLNRELTSGEYDAMIHVQPYKMDAQKTPANNADMKVKLVVK